MSRRRASAFTTDSELSLSQTDEIRLKAVPGSGQRGSSAEAAPWDPWVRRKAAWLIYFVGFIDLFGVSMMIPLLPRYTRNLGASPALAGLIGSVYGAVQVFSSPFMGKLSDSYGRKAVLLVAYAGPAVSYFAMGQAPSLTVLVLFRLPAGFLKHGLSISKAYLTDITPSEERQAVLGMFNAVSSLGFIFGPLIAGYLADWDTTLRLSLLSGAVVYTADLVIVALFVAPSRPGVKPIADGDVSQALEKLSFRKLVDSVNIFKGVNWRVQLDLIYLRFLVTFAVIIFRSNFSLFLEDHFQVDYKTIGKIISFNGVSAAIAGVSCGVISKAYSNQSKQLQHFTFLLAISIALLTLSPNITLFLAFLIPLSLSTANLRICTLSLMLERGSPEERGAIIGLGNSINSLSRMLAPTLVGLAQEFGTETAGYLAALLALLAATVMVLRPLTVHSKS